VDNFCRSVNGHVLLIEEVRTGCKTLAVASIRKFKAGGGHGRDGAPGRPNAPVEPPVKTSETHFPAPKM